MAHKYLDNPYIQHYLQEIDAAVDDYIAARNRGDWNAIGGTLKTLNNLTAQTETRTGKITRGTGDSINSSGWNPPAQGKKPPAAVRAEEE